MRIGVAQTDITPNGPVWLTGYGNRDHQSEGVYRPLQAGAVYLEEDREAAVVLTADVLGFSPAYAAALRADLALDLGLLPRQIVLTATHTHCAPLFWPMIMPGEVETGYAALLPECLRQVAAAARGNARAGHVRFSRGRSDFGVNRRLPDGGFGPNPDGPVDRDLDTLWFCAGRPDGAARPEVVGSLTVYGCHPTSMGGYRVGPDYPGYLCGRVTAATGAPALFATGCGGNVRPWFRRPGQAGFAQPTLEELEAAGSRMGDQVLATWDGAAPVRAEGFRADRTVHLLPYAQLPDAAALEEVGQHADALHRRWARQTLEQLEHGPLPRACPQEIQVLRFSAGLRVVFLAGEVLTEIGQHVKQALAPATTVVAAYSNGLIAYVAGAATYPLGGYEVQGSHVYYGRPAPFAADAEERIVAAVRALAAPAA